MSELLGKIMSLFQINKLKADRLAAAREAKYPNPFNDICGHKVEYLFLTETEAGEGVCGVDGRIIDTRRNPDDPHGNGFFADIAVETHVNDFYIPLTNLYVTCISSEGREGVLIVADYEDIDKIIAYVNRADNPSKTHLTLVKG